MKVVKGVVLVVVAAGVFNGVVVSAYFRPVYEGDAEPSRYFGFWLVGWFGISGDWGRGEDDGAVNW